MAKRTIVIGDIHACYEELLRLLEACDYGGLDQVVSVGDLVDRGPEPEKVVRFFMSTPQASAILGNHEDKNIRVARGDLTPGPAQTILRKQLGDFYPEAIAYFTSLPLCLELPEALVVHAGFQLDLGLQEQPRNALLRGLMPWMKNIFDEAGPHWTEVYRDDRTIIYGHSVRASVHVVNNTWGIDTGACRGGALSALVLPEFKVVQVPAARNYWAETLARYEGWLRSVSPPKPVAAVPAPKHLLEIEGKRINGDWLSAHYGMDRSRAGPWVGELIKLIHSGIRDGSIETLEDLLEILPPRDQLRL